MYSNEDNNFFENDDDYEKIPIINTSISKLFKDTGPKIISLEDISKYSSVFISVNPFIYNGYRIHHNVCDCIRSMYKMHNETFNIWTHKIPFIAFLLLLINKSKGNSL